MFKNNILAALVVLGMSSCNPIGEKIAEIPLSAGEIGSANAIDLKKGDVITIWSKVSERSDKEDAPFKVKYNIERDGQRIIFDSLKVTDGNHIINAEKTTESYTESSSAGDSTKHYTLKQFEIENKKITIPRDGKYNFDFKLVDGDYDFFNNDMLITLRKTR
jgi:hypothetical protein